MFRKIILPLFVFFAFSAVAQDDNGKAETVKAELVQKKMYNKAGKEMPGDGDLFLLVNGDEIFIKLSESKLTQDELTPHLNTKMSFVVVRKNGLWDTDDPNVQSRIGDYVIILEIVDK